MDTVWKSYYLDSRNCEPRPESGKMRIHYLQHVFFEDPGCIGKWAFQNNHTLSGTRLYAQEPLPELTSFDALVVMGGPMGVNDEDRFPWLAGEKTLIAQAIRARKKVLGVCLGAQLIASALGCPVRKNQQREIGWFPLSLSPEAQNSPLRVLPEAAMVFHWHSDTFEVPPGMQLLASSAACQNQAFALDDRVLALQFHLEVSENGVLDLIKYCGDEMTDGAYIQNSQQIFGSRTLFPRANFLMDKVLDRFLV